VTSETVKSTLKEISPSRRELDLEIPEADVRAEYERILGTYAKRVKLAGFRKGHAPRDLVRKLFDADIRHDVTDSLIPRIVRQELQGLRANPVNVPVVRDLTTGETGPLRCTVAFEVVPEFELPDTRTIKVSPPDLAVDDGEVGTALEEMRERAAEYVPVEGRGAVKGDYTVAEIQGRDLKTKRLLPAEKVVILAGHPDNESALDQHLLGMKPGEAKTFEVTYEKDHRNKRLAGKTIAYTLKVKDIKERKLPALDDDFAKSLGDYPDLPTLKEKVRGGLAASKEKVRRNSMASEVLREIGKLLHLELPESLVALEAQAVLRRLLEASRPGGRRLSPEALEELKTQARKEAEEHLTNHLILEKIAATEGLEITEAEIQNEIRSLAAANRVAPAALAEMIKRENRGDEIRETLLFRKAVDFLVKNAIIR
jgi:trigger factor